MSNFMVVGAEIAQRSPPQVLVVSSHVVEAELRLAVSLESGLRTQ